MRARARIFACLLAIAVAAPVASAGALASSRVERASGIGSTVWIVGGHSGGGFISRSADFGASFQASPTAVRGVSVAADKTDPTAALALLSGRNFSYLSQDGGLTWDRSPGQILAGEGFVMRDVAWLASGGWAVVGQDSETENGHVAFIRTSFDQGLDWGTGFEGPFYPPPDEFSPPPQTWAEMYSIDATAGGRVAWAIGNEYEPSSGSDGSKFIYYRPLIYKTENGGATWTTQTATSAMTKGNTVWSVAAASTSTAFIGIGDSAVNQILRTRDGGANWEVVEVPRDFTLPATNGNGIDALDENTVLVVGDLGKIAFTTSASETSPTWTHKRMPIGNYQLYGAQMLDATHWVVVGDHESVFRTSNGGATWTGVMGPTAPTVSLTAPAASFSLNAGAVTLSGASADVGVGVARVDVRVRRADGMCWDGLQWVGADTWVRANRTAGSWASWFYSWTPDMALLATGQIVNVTARSTDGLGLQKLSTTVASRAGVSGTPAISLADGAHYSASSMVTAAVSPEGFAFMRWREGAGVPSAWAPSATSKVVDLGSGDGTKTIVFDFSVDGSSVSKSATDTIVLDATAPAVSITSPTDYFSPANVSCSGTSSDSGSGVSDVAVRIRNGAGEYWDGASFAAAETWLPASGTAAWSYNDQSEGGSTDTTLPVTITAKATDVAGNSATSASVVSKSAATAAIKVPPGPVAYGTAVSISGTLSVLGAAAASGKSVQIQSVAAASGAVTTIATVVTDGAGRFSAGASAIQNAGYRVVFSGDASLTAHSSSTVTNTVYAALTVPAVPATVYRNKTFTTSGALTPRHTAGSPAVKLEFWRLYRNLNGTVTWKYVKQVPARVANSATASTYSAASWLPYAGTWRVRAVHGDASHALTRTAFKTFSVR